MVFWREHMPVKLVINSQPIAAPAGPSLFDYAERLGVRVPTSCRKQGKCRECLVEVIEGANHVYWGREGELARVVAEFVEP